MRRQEKNFPVGALLNKCSPHSRDSKSSKFVADYPHTLTSPF